MTLLARRFRTAAAIAGAGFLIALGAQLRLARAGRPAEQPPADAAAVPAASPYIEGHSHFDEKDPDGTLRSVLAALSHQNTKKIYLQIPPDTFDHPGHYDVEVILEAAKKYPDKVGILGGGGTLNAMIMQSVQSGDAGPAVQKKFKAQAEVLLRKGVAGFGEMTAEHFAGITPYQYAPADHPLYLLLADIAAQHGVPIDIHMEAVPAAMPLPPPLKSPPNAPELRENITAFERLLAHNRRAKIIWAHTGTDGTGFRTPELCRQLLERNANLYMEIKMDPENQGRNYPADASGKIKPDWLKLFQDFPDRFIIGSDQHYPQPKGTQRWQTVVMLFNQLPADLRKKIGTENMEHLYSSKK